MKLKKLKKTNHSKVLLIIVNQPLTRHTYGRLGVNTTYKEWKIVYWNILPIINRKLNKIYSRKGQRSKEDESYVQINSLSDLIKEYKKIPNKFFYISTDGKKFSISLLNRILSFSGGTRIIHFDESFLIKKKYFNVIRNLMPNNKIHLLKKIIFYCFDNIIKYLNDNILQPEPKIILVTNYKSYLISKKKFKNKKILKMNSYDFEIFNKLKKKKLINKKRITFIDQMFEGPFDHQLNKYFEKPDFQYYWSAIDKLLNFLAKKVYNNDELIVAAHHRRNRFDLPANNKFVFDKTHQLIKESKLVLGHESTVLNHAALLRKPIIFINMHMFKMYEYRSFQFIKLQAKALGMQTIYIDKNFKFNQEIVKKIKANKINEKKYKKFAEYYLGFPGSKSYGRWKTILKHLDNNKFN